METTRYFLTYSGRTLPLQLTEELPVDGLRHRNTWFEATYAPDGRTLGVVKLVYGDIEMRHVYDYDEQGRLCRATITIGEDEPMQVAIA